MPESMYSRPDLLLAAFGTFAALLALNVHRPFRPNVSLGAVAFFLGWLTGELAMHHVVLQVVGLVYFVYEGALRGPFGYVGAFLTLGSIVSLLHFHASGHQVGALSVHALSEGGVESRSTKVRNRDLIRPFHMKRKTVTVRRSIEIARVGGTPLHVDVYRREDAPPNAPVVVYVHGGGWVIGFRRYQGLPILHALAEQGFVCISAGYRLSPRATFPEHAHDVFRAIAWAKENAATYGGDASRVALVGNSAGAHLAAVAALGENEPRLRPPELEGLDLKTVACVCLYGVFDMTNRESGTGFRPFMERTVLKATYADDPDLYRVASPVELIDQASPPFLVIHGNRDSLVPVEQSRRFVDALRERSGSPAVYIEVDGAQHAFDIFHSVRGRYAVQTIVTFLQAKTTHAAAGQSAETRTESRACEAS